VQVIGSELGTKQASMQSEKSQRCSMHVQWVCPVHITCAGCTVQTMLVRFTLL
jgi:hypothetical protein